MLDLDQICDTIKELEEGPTTYENCHRLASLYIIRYFNQPEFSPVEKELSDILPSYKKYVTLKTEYQKGNLDKEPVLKSFKMVTAEIEEFIHILYSNTDMEEEREFLYNMKESLTFLD